MAVILIMSCGAMGAALAQLLVLAGHRTLAELWAANSAGPAAERVSVVASVLPPSEATAFAAEFARCVRDAAAAKGTTAAAAAADEGDAEEKGLFLELNAVAPATSAAIAAQWFAPPGGGGGGEGVGDRWTYVDGCIIGLPPVFGDAARPSLDSLVHNPAVYLAAAFDVAAVSRARDLLTAGGWRVRVLDGGGEGGLVGATKALKMSYSSVAKGVMGLTTSAALSASSYSASTRDALARELAESLPGVAQFAERQMRNVVPKSTRFVGEMEEIAAYVGATTGADELAALWTGMAGLYSFVSRAKGNEKGDEIDSTLRSFGSRVSAELELRRQQQQQQQQKE
ncbi:hypothetical protein DFJ73DRAFT_798248 [Zopfochytrium polystomum]|nr:hypothetical protein DFJ73DRAFT_798248 [Zopfochytrium polystomum]